LGDLLSNILGPISDIASNLFRSPLDQSGQQDSSNTFNPLSTIFGSLFGSEFSSKKEDSDEED